MDSAQVTVTVPVTTSPASYALASVCTTTSHLGRDDDAASWLGAGISLAGADASDADASDAVGVGGAAAGPSTGSAAVILRGRSVKIAWGSFASPSTGETRMRPGPRPRRRFVRPPRCGRARIVDVSTDARIFGEQLHVAGTGSGEGASGRGLLDAAALHSV